MVLVSTPGATNANTYADAAYASAYFASRIGSEVWDDADVDVQVAALAQSASLLDSMFEWIGSRAEDGQGMRWPRSWAEDLDGYEYSDDVIPENVKKAQCELAIFLISNGGYTAESRDVDKITLGSIRLDFDSSASALPIPSIVIELLRGLGVYRGSGKSGSISTPIYRV